MDLTNTPTTWAIVLVVLIGSLSLHEMMHAYAGFRLGDTTARDQGRISLNPLRHIDPFMTIILPALTLLTLGVPVLAAKPVPFNPDRVKWDEFGAAIIALAGPLTNLLIAAVAGMLARLVGAGGFYDALRLVVELNVVLFVFNIIPIPPLDGSRVLYAVAPEPLQEFMASLEQYGIFIVFGLVLFVPPFVNMLSNINSGITQFLL